MLRTLIVGYGRSGGHLHLPSIGKARQLDRAGIFASQPPYAIDPKLSPTGTEEVQLRHALEDTGDIDPAHTVTHICTPPANRMKVLDTLVGYGFRRFIIEKPLATSISELNWLEQLVNRAALDIGVSIPWLSSTLTQRLRAELLDESHGSLERVETTQDKSRITRSLQNTDHASAFEVELPHAVAVVSHLAGEATEVTGAATFDLLAEGTSLSHMGGAYMEAVHEGGVTSRMSSNLQAPRRERCLRLICSAATVTGYYPVSAEDHYSQIVLEPLDGRPTQHELMFDDAFPRMVLEWYRYFAGLTPRPVSDLHLNSSVVRTIAQARGRSGLTAPESTIAAAV